MPGRDRQSLQDMLENARRALALVGDADAVWRAVHEDLPSLIEQLERALAA